MRPKRKGRTAVYYLEGGHCVSVGGAYREHWGRLLWSAVVSVHVVF